ncbi:MAG TPA: GAF domain-containing sensor histidine kinase [Acidimicrobiia bacterium]|nr:GAF domain-containing sensor histidine kinase [Acidimicrobiia bacterium]
MATPARPTPDVPVSGAPASAALRAVTDAVLGLAGEPALEPVLERLVHAVRDLVGARYAALGIPDEDGTGFDRFITSGMTDEQIEAIGPLPRTHGLLAAMLTDPEPYRTDDIRADPRFEWWPEAHPRMRSFLGVPLLFKGDIVGAFYLTDKDGGFDEADVELVRGLAAHAAVVIENARLSEASRERSIAEERSRLARDLHDALTQRLFSLNLTLEAAAATAAGPDPAPTLEAIHETRALVDASLAELRTLIFELRPPALESDGLTGALRKHAEVLTRAYGVPVTVADTRPPGAPGPGADAERPLWRVAQEALSNALRHAGASAVSVTVEADGPGGGTRLSVADDGGGFDPDARSIAARRLGLVSMRERIESVGGSFEIVSAPGRGTTVRASVPPAGEGSRR